MSPTLTISFDVPEGTAVSIVGVEGGTVVTGPPRRDPVEEYWNDYLSPSGRKVFETAARIEDVRGPGYSFEDIADALSVDYDSVKSYHRNAGRTAGRWQRDKGTPAPIRLEFDGNYGPQTGATGLRSRYGLPAGIADKVLALA